ncbi:MAG: hypothetical protein IKU31_01210 [Oscillospiraceae bacterium]|nr:hypothetical protein [Oscillospiraceae bacterium]
MLEMKIGGKSDYIFCPYCGQQFFVDDGKKTYTINQNININKNIKVDKTIHNRYTNDAEVIKAQNKEKEDRRLWVASAVSFVVLLCIIIIPLVAMRINETSARNEGKISAGYYRDLLGKDYETVEAHFESAGFTNIELIDLDDSGLAFWKNGKVETISIGGDTSFDSTDFFDPETKVVISYH